MTRDVSSARLTGVRIIVFSSCLRANYTMLVHVRPFFRRFRSSLLSLINRDDGSRVLS